MPAALLSQGSVAEPPLSSRRSISDLPPPLVEYRKFIAYAPNL
jgi:hypothetical protein